MTRIRKSKLPRNTPRKPGGKKKLSFATQGVLTAITGLVVWIFWSSASSSTGSTNSTSNTAVSGRGRQVVGPQNLASVLSHSLERRQKGSPLRGVVDTPATPVKDDPEPEEEEAVNPVELLYADKEEEEEDDKDATTDSGGSHTTSRAYVADYQYERNHPSFRTASLQIQLDGNLGIAREEQEDAALQPCQYQSHPGGPILFRATCQQEDEDGNNAKSSLVAYNGQDFARTWCDTSIAPHSSAHIDLNSCTSTSTDAVRLFAMDVPPVSGESMPPITLLSKPPSEDRIPKLEAVDCNVPCEKDVKLAAPSPDRRTSVYIGDSHMTVHQSLQDPVNKDGQVERNDYRNGIYYSTTSLMSSVPLSKFDFDKYDIGAAPLKYEDLQQSASYLVSGKCFGPNSKRNKWAQAVGRHLKLAAYGECEHNTNVPDGMSLTLSEDRIKLHRKHIVNLAFESSTEKDYITDITWEAFQSGAVPVVVGASNLASQHLPRNSFISSNDFQSWDALGKYVKEVAENKTLWMSYHTWRSDPEALETFRERYEFTRTSQTCRLCRFSYAERYGLRWNQAKQRVEEPVIKKELCVDARTNLVVRPFVESFHLKASEALVPAEPESAVCNNLDDAILVEANDFKVHRRVQLHDNVVDLSISSIEGAQGEMVMRLQFNVDNTEGSAFLNPHILTQTVRGPLCTSIAIQDTQSKVTVLANWATNIRSTSEGLIEIVLQKGSGDALHPDETRRIRIITEDINTLTDKLTEFYPSSFAKMMTKDFVDPLEVFYSDDSQ